MLFSRWSGAKIRIFTALTKFVFVPLHNPNPKTLERPSAYAPGLSPSAARARPKGRFAHGHARCLIFDVVRIVKMGIFAPDRRKNSSFHLIDDFD